MIIVRLQGGLGNQLFQYAAGKALAEKNNCSLKLDCQLSATPVARNLDLSNFRLVYETATEKEINLVKPVTTLGRLKARLASYPGKKFYKEPFFHYNERFAELGNDVYIQGYFQSEKYFSAIDSLLRTELQPKPAIVQKHQLLAHQLQESTSVSLHIRRGDYTDRVAAKVHGILPLAYYRAALASLDEQVKQLQLYIFSDDVEWAQSQLNLPNAAMVSGTITTNHLEDFYLMSQCRYNIIANSSFSWWAAWLNTHPEKKVIAPKNWFNNGPKDTQDLLPADWLCL